MIERISDESIEDLVEFLNKEADLYDLRDASAHLVSRFRRAAVLVEAAQQLRKENREEVSQLTALIRQLVQHVPEDTPVREQALDYLTRYEVTDPVMREEAVSAYEFALAERAQRAEARLVRLERLVINAYEVLWAAKTIIETKESK